MIKKYRWLLLLFLIILFFLMADPVWEGLAKSGVDPEKIEEAINRLIQAHDDDPDAHLDVGQSLQSHRASEIIDHEAASIVADKFSDSSGMIYIPNAKVADLPVDQMSGGGVGSYANYSHNSPLIDPGYAIFFDILPPDWGWTNGDLVTDFHAIATGSVGTWQMRVENGFGAIEWKKDFIRFGYYDGTWHYTTFQSFTPAFPHKYRIRYDSVAGKLQFFADGVLKYERAYSIVIEDDEFKLRAWLNRGSSSFSTITLGNMYAGFSV